MSATATYTIRKSYHTGQKMLIDDFDQDGEVIITFFPKQKEQPYIESKQYLEDPSVFEGTDKEAIAFLTKRIKKNANHPKKTIS